LTNQYHCGNIIKGTQTVPVGRVGARGWTEGNMDFGRIRQTGAARNRVTNKAVKSFRINKAQKAKPISQIESAR
jgi:hypothetical protein